MRADDRLDADLCIECGDVDWELVASFADRSLDSHEASQRLDEADTIADVVHLLDALPHDHRPLTRSLAPVAGRRIQ